MRVKGDYSRVNRYLEKAQNVFKLGLLDKYGQAGVDALALATPKDSGQTSQSWIYNIERTDEGTKLVWSNTNEHSGVNIAVILQYGHGTGTGGYVTGIDYINPAMRPIFEKIASDAWKEVTDL